MSPRLLALLALSGCAMEFDPPSLLDDVRVLAIETTPLELEPFEPIALRPKIFVPAGAARPTLSWRFCPFTLGARASFACAVPACEVSLEADMDGNVVADPTALALACAARSTTTSSATIDELPEYVELLFTLEVGDDVSVARVPFYPKGAPTPRNRAPRISSVAWTSGLDAAGALAREGKAELTVTADETTLDEYVDARGQTRREEPVVSFYSTAGRFSKDRDDAIVARSELEAIELAATTTTAEVYVVLRDGRGGQAVGGPLRLPLR